MRILGGGSFVSRILDETDLIRKHRLANLDREKMALQLVESACEKGGISVQALSGGSRLRDVSNVRRELAQKMTEQLGLSFAETARLLGVSTSGIATILRRRKIKK